MFKGCSSLKTLPDISKLKNIINLNTITDRDYSFTRDKGIKPIKY